MLRKSILLLSALLTLSPLYAQDEMPITEIPATHTASPYYDLIIGYEAGLIGAQVYGVARRGMIAFPNEGVESREVYIQNPVGSYMKQTWVKGLLSEDGKKIRVELPQAINRFTNDEGQPQTTWLNKMVMVDDYTPKIVDAKDNYVEYSVKEDGTVGFDWYGYGGLYDKALDGCFIGVTVSNENPADNLIENWTRCGDMAHYLTPFSETPLTMPAGLTAEDWMLSGDGVAEQVKVAIDGDKVYISGLYKPLPEGTVMGTINGDEVKFAADQYLGYDPDMQCFVFFKPAQYTYDAEGYKNYSQLSALTMAYDAEEAEMRYLRADQGMMMNTMREHVLYIKSYDAPVIRKIREEDEPGRPAAPEFADYFFYDQYGFGSVAWNIPAADEAGKPIPTDRLNYTLYIDGAPYTLSTANYKNLEQDMCDIPYPFTDDYDITVEGPRHTLYIYDKPKETWGICSWYQNKEGEKVYSMRTLYNVATKEVTHDDPTVSVKELESASADGPAEYYTLQGLRITNLTDLPAGIYIRRQGSHSSKILIK